MEQQLEMLKHLEAGKKKTLWRNGIEEVLMDLSKVKNLLVGAGRNVTWLGPSFSFEC